MPRSAVPTLEIHPKDIIRDLYRNLCKKLITQLFTLATKWSPIIGGRLNKAQYIQTTIYYVASKN